MDPRKNMIIVKGEIKTREIRSCKYNSYTKKWDIISNKDNKVFSCGYLSVEWLKNPQEIDPDVVRVSRKGKDFFNIAAIYVFHGSQKTYWHICFKNGSERDYDQTELSYSVSCLNNPSSKNVFQYLKEISGINELKNDETGERILEKRFETLRFIDEENALSRYLNPSINEAKQKTEIVPIFPFGCNKSQYKAVKNALENQISVIEGPPGTGKTQTILNIIANIILQGKTVQIVSNNNSAIENVFEKLSSEKYNLGFIVAQLGNVKNKKTFIQNQKIKYPDFSSWILRETDLNPLEEVKRKSEQLADVFYKQERLASLKQELARLELEQKYFEEYLSETNVRIDLLQINKRITSNQLLELWQKCQEISEEKKKIGVFFKLKSYFLCGINNQQFFKQNISKIITSFQGQFFKYKREELIQEIENISNSLENVSENLLPDLCRQSMEILKDTLAKKYGDKKERVQFSEDDLWKNAQSVLKEYPVILSTTFSSRTSLNNEVRYDYLIMDEASQVDIATGAMALSCAKNAVIVGDTKQLPNIVTREAEETADKIFAKFNVNEGYKYTKSFLQSILEVVTDVPRVLLREHYRCHPKIINFCNQKFYKGELIIMTEDHEEDNVLTVVKTVEGNHERGHYSQRQIDVIKEEIIPDLNIEKNEIGIIAPYRDQVAALESQINGIDIATVHKFQGREKDAIIISTVDDEISDFVDDPYLLNVAVSRAKNKFVLVVSGNMQEQKSNIRDLISYIQYNNFEVQESRIYSIFDYLYTQYTEAKKDYLKKHKRISEYDSENLMFGLLTDIINKDVTYMSLDVVHDFPLNMLIRDLKLLNDRECEYVMNPAAHLDFLIFNKVSKAPVLAIEVDGYDYHKIGTEQYERDKMKDHVLELYDIPMLRFKTNGSGEEEKIKAKLKELINR